MGTAAKYRMRHRQHDEEETNRKGGQQVSLNMPQRRRREKRREPALQRPDSTEERRLKARTTARRLRDLEQQLSVRRWVAERRHHPVVAVHLDRKA